jgi:hypothetical protein
MPSSSHTVDRVHVTFDDDRAVADAGLVLTGTLMGRLGLEQVTDETVSWGIGRAASWRRWCTR